MIINITILEDNESDFITLSDSIKKWAANTGTLINIIWLNSYKKFIKILYLIFDYPHKHYTFKYFAV